jgi:hypothetical protein
MEFDRNDTYQQPGPTKSPPPLSYQFTNLRQQVMRNLYHCGGTFHASLILRQCLILSLFFVVALTPAELSFVPSRRQFWFVSLLLLLSALSISCHGFAAQP